MYGVRAATVWLLICCALATRSAHADVELAPAADGYVGAFLVLGPLAGSTRLEDALGNIDAAFGRPGGAGLPGTWRLLYDGHGALDLQRELASQRPGNRALVSGVLSLTEPLDGWLLVSVDGALTVSIDGTIVWSQTGQRLRGGSWDTISVQLDAGQHAVTLGLEHPGAHWALETRWLSKNDLRPPRGARWILKGVPHHLEQRLAASMLDAKLDSTLTPEGFVPELELAYRRGAPMGGSRSVSVRTRLPTGTTQFKFGPILVNEHGAQRLEARLPRLGSDDLFPGRRRQVFEILVENHQVQAALAVSRQAVELVARATAVRQQLLSRPDISDDLREVLVATFDAHRAELERASATGHPHLLASASAQLEQLLDAFSRDPDFLFRPGVHALAHPSALDSQPQGFWLHVPEGFEPGQAKRYPAVLALHGYNGSPQGILQAFVDTKSKRASPRVDGFVIAPEAHGNAFYRGPGEFEAMAVLERVRRMYPIDENRISVTGVSMGGTGAAHLALRYPDVFSAAAPLCGYHSYFIRRDVQGKPLRSWEEARMHHWSTASWADNGRHIPLFVAHGTRDYPLENSRVLIRAYQALGFSVQQEWPDIGHAVWTISYQGARLWPWLSRHVRPQAPDHVTLSSDTLRYAHQHWIEVRQFTEFGRRARLDAQRIDPTTTVVQTDNVSSFRLALDPRAPSNQRPTVVVDGQALRLEPTPWVELYRTDRWHTGPAPKAKLQKLPGLEGPIRDVFLGPVAFVYGSQSPRTARINREVAERFGRYHSGTTLEYPVIADRDWTPKLARSHSLVLVGTADDHSVLRRIASSLPIHRTGRAIWLGKQKHVGQDLGAIFVYPNPEAPARYVVVITGVDVGGILRALSLPRLLPDFVIYDVNLRNAAAEQVLGSAQVRAAGYFSNTWALP